MRIIKRKKIVAVLDNRLIAVRGYRVYQSFDGGHKWECYAQVNDLKNRLLGITQLSRRLTRAEITKLYVMKDGTEFCIARKGIFRKEKDSNQFVKCFNITKGSRPNSILIDEEKEKIYFGEYYINYAKAPMNIYCSEDKGKNWHVAYTFEEGMINHVHGVFKDPYTGYLWVITGDRENECIIGYTKDEFNTFDILYRGGQDYRSCVLFFYKDAIVYATDSQYQQCQIKRIDRKNHEITAICDIQGPVIRGTQCGDYALLATDVEPSDFNHETKAFVWYSNDGENWKQLYGEEKDCWHPKYFQFGTFDLPQYYVNKVENTYISGKALKKIDGDTLVFPKEK